MKKSCIALMITIILFFVINNIAQKTYADTINETGYSSYMQSYFDNLDVNYPANHHGSCGYIATAVLLAYYDTFHDDRIIPEFYDVPSITLESQNIIRSSPGICNDDYVNGHFISTNPLDGYNNSEFINAMVDRSNDNDFTAYLIRLGEENGYYPYEESSLFASIAYTQIPTLISKYLTHTTNIAVINEGLGGREFLSLSDNDFLIENSFNINAEPNGESVRAFVVNKLQFGTPVILSLYERNDAGVLENGHVVVAYYYDSLNDNIWCFWGQRYAINNTVVLANNGSKVYQAATALTFNTPHNCSNNYVVQTKDTNGNVISEKTYCYEHKDIITYNHVCSYGEWVTTDAKHTKTCHCTEKIEGAHTYDSNNTCTVCEHHTHDYHYSYVSRTQCKGVCEYCNYQIITTHDINLLTKVCRQCFARFFNDGVEVPINNLPPDIVCTKNHQHNSSCVIVARE